MKKTLSYVFSGMVGGLFCFLLVNQFPAKTTIIQESAPQSKQVSLTNLPVVGPDFVTAAKVSTPAVVHIYAEESTESAQDRLEKERRRNPFGGDLFSEFFGGGDFFGRNYYRQSGTGSGVIISKDGYIVTNNHVVGFADNITVTTHQGKKYNGKKVGTDPSTDLAVIKIEGDFTPAVFGDSDKLNVGEWVLAVGNPFDYLTSTVTAGIVSAKGRSLDIIKDEKAIEEFIQTDAAINPGNSGGALVDVNGKLIGINTAIATPTGVFAGYSFAIPSNLVKPIIDKI
ncbi:MAG TPA: trypsin-like peptidase domain-containing protein, partial [Saprospiraceae bacterium]|nr:trypsin-like peptidase domain-containing protein [Saprospiraceae bacterium]